jgi:fatty-acyl-CoA synthase
MNAEPCPAPFHLGAFRAACLARRRSFRSAIHGARAALRDGEWIPRQSNITVTVSAPIPPDGSDFGAMTRLRDRVRSQILAHCGEPEVVAQAAAKDE